MSDKIAFLLGAGSSQAAGFPSTRKLTEQIVSGHGVSRNGDGSYYIDADDKPPTALLRLVQSMVEQLRAEANPCYSSTAGKSANYEDIYYLARQVHDELSGETENPAIRLFVNALKDAMSPLVKDEHARMEDPNGHWEQHLPDDLEGLLREVCNFIADIVAKSLLSHSSASGSESSVIASVCKSANVSSISTVCHDTHLEEFLESEGVELVDGFSDSDRSVPHWTGGFSSDVKTPFLKLHGSVNWFRYTDRSIRRVPPPCYPQRLADAESHYAEDGRPLLLIGTFNKMADYSSGVFLELHYRFRATLRESSKLVVCGYSFGDKGINEEVVGWIEGGKGRLLVVIHPDPSRLVASARGAIRNGWDEWNRRGVIRLIEKRLECVTMDDCVGAVLS